MNETPVIYLYIRIGTKTNLHDLILNTNSYIYDVHTSLHKLLDKRIQPHFFLLVECLK